MKKIILDKVEGLDTLGRIKLPEMGVRCIGCGACIEQGKRCEECEPTVSLMAPERVGRQLAAGSRVYRRQGEPMADCYERAERFAALSGKAVAIYQGNILVSLVQPKKELP